MAPFPTNVAWDVALGRPRWWPTGGEIWRVKPPSGRASRAKANTFGKQSNMFRRLAGGPEIHCHANLAAIWPTKCHILALQVVGGFFLGGGNSDLAVLGPSGGLAVSN